MSDLEGRWETEGRNPIVGAFVLVLLLGSVYFIIQSLLVNGYVAVAATRAATSDGPEFELGTSFQAVALGALALTQYGILLALGVVLVRRWHTGGLFGYLRLDSFSLGPAVIAVVGVVGLIPAVSLLAEILYSLFPGLEELSQMSNLLVQAESPIELVLVLFGIAVTPAICEEFLFRAYFQRTLERRLRVPWHFVISGVIFALFHQQVLSLPSLVLVGVYLSFIYYAFQSPYPSVFAHFFYNALLIGLANSETGIRGIVDEGSFTLAALIGGLGLVGFAVAIGIREHARARTGR